MSTVNRRSIFDLAKGDDDELFLSDSESDSGKSKENIRENTNTLHRNSPTKLTPMSELVCNDDSILCEEDPFADDSGEDEVEGDGDRDGDSGDDFEVKEITDIDGLISENKKSRDSKNQDYCNDDQFKGSEEREEGSDSENSDLEILNQDRIDELRANAEAEVDNNKRGLNWEASGDGKEDSEGDIGTVEVDRILSTMERSAKDGAGVAKVSPAKTLQAKLFPHQEVGFGWLYSHEYHQYGGMLCDDQGLGKTVEVISLILKNTPTKYWQKEKGKTFIETAKNRHLKVSLPSRTLIVVPLSTLHQWESEIDKFSGKSLKVMFHYGKYRQNSFEDADVVITTYGTLRSEVAPYVYDYDDTEIRRYLNDIARFFLPQSTDTTNDSLLLRETWFRIVCDESHIMKNHKTITWGSLTRLHALNRWCLTGTPIHNSMNELYSQLAFIRIPELGSFADWDREIAEPIKRSAQSQGRRVYHKKKKIWLSIQEIKKEAQEAWEKLGTIVDKHVLRRTKLTRDHIGLPLIPLPQRKTRIRQIPFSSREIVEYKNLEKGAQFRFKLLLQQAKEERQSTYMNMLTLILRLRQFCCHPVIVAAAYHIEGDPFDKLAERVLNTDDHGYLDEDFFVNNTEEASEDEDEQKKVKKLSFKEGLRKILQDELGEEKTQSKDPFSSLWASSKMNALFQDLIELRRSSTRMKAILFSQFTTYLDIIEMGLKRLGFKLVRLDGTLSQEKRKDAIKSFQEDPEVHIFLISLMSGGLGLNLVAASHIFMCDFWWNPALEDQAVDRVHRIGQSEPVNVIRYCMANSIEVNMLDIQERKRALSCGAFGEMVAETKTLSIKDIYKLFGMEKEYGRRNRNYANRFKRLKMIPLSNKKKSGESKEETKEEEKKRRKKEEDIEGMKSWNAFQSSTAEKLAECCEGEFLSAGENIGFNFPSLTSICAEFLTQEENISLALVHNKPNINTRDEQILKLLFKHMAHKEETQINTIEQVVANKSKPSLIQVYGSKRGPNVKQMLNLIRPCSKSLTSLTLQSINGMKEEMLIEILSNTTQLRELRLPYNSAAITNAVIDTIADCSTLKRIDITCAYMVTNFDPLFQMHGVQELSLAHCPEARLTNNDLSAMIWYATTSLECLDLSCCGNLEATLAESAELGSMVLEYSNKGTVLGELFQDCKYLKRLSLSGQSRYILNSKTLRAICEMIHLEELDLSECESVLYFDWFVKHLSSRLTKLKVLKLANLSMQDEDDTGTVPNPGILGNFKSNALAEEKTSETLGYFRDQLAEAALKKQREEELKARLERQRQESKKRIRESLGYICLLENLETLDLNMCVYIDDTALKRIASGCKKLRYLNLSACTDISLKGFKVVRNIRTLTDVDLSWCPIDNDCAFHIFSTLPLICTIKLFGCTGISSETLKRLYTTLGERNRTYPVIYA